MRSSYSPLVQRPTVSQPAAGAAYDYHQESYFYKLNAPAFQSYEQRMRDRRPAKASRFYSAHK